jgi:hypothetical protein
MSLHMLKNAMNKEMIITKVLKSGKAKHVFATKPKDIHYLSCHSTDMYTTLTVLKRYKELMLRYSPVALCEKDC